MVKVGKLTRQELVLPHLWIKLQLIFYFNLATLHLFHKGILDEAITSFV